MKPTVIPTKSPLRKSKSQESKTQQDVEHNISCGLAITEKQQHENICNNKRKKNHRNVKY